MMAVQAFSLLSEKKEKELSQDEIKQAHSQAQQESRAQSKVQKGK
jgi:hypothetical protein